MTLKCDFVPQNERDRHGGKQRFVCIPKGTSWAYLSLRGIWTYRLSSVVNRGEVSRDFFSQSYFHACVVTDKLSSSFFKYMFYPHPTFKYAILLCTLPSWVSRQWLSVFFKYCNTFVWCSHWRKWESYCTFCIINSWKIWRAFVHIQQVASTCQAYLCVHTFPAHRSEEIQRSISKAHGVKDVQDVWSNDEKRSCVFTILRCSLLETSRLGTYAWGVSFSQRCYPTSGLGVERFPRNTVKTMWRCRSTTYVYSWIRIACSYHNLLFIITRTTFARKLYWSGNNSLKAFTT